MLPPQVIFGCASIGKSYSTQEEVSALLETLKAVGISHLDTAARYPPTSPGLSEKLLGEAGVGNDETLTVDTKILIAGEGRACLSDTAITNSLTQSYRSLGISKTKKINILYCHGPDQQTPIAEQAASFSKYYKEGKFDHLEVSNFSKNMIEEWLRIADKEGYVKPTFYQGQYNLVCRSYEDGFFDFLRKEGIHFNAFSPLAGGFLTGKLTPETDPSSLKGTRFEVADNNPFGKAFRHWYEKPSMHETIAKLRTITLKAGITMEAASLGWLLYHSALGSDDGVIIGASRLSQVKGTTQAIAQGSLPEALVRQMDGLWQICKGDAEAIVNY